MDKFSKMIKSIGNKIKKETQKGIDKAVEAMETTGANKAVKDIGDNTNKLIDKSRVKEKSKHIYKKTDEFLDKKGIKAAAKKAGEVSKENMDTFTGQKHLKLLEEKMILQQRYNDILATKLEEALQRIEALEKKV